VRHGLPLDILAPGAPVGLRARAKALCIEFSLGLIALVQVAHTAVGAGAFLEWL